MILRVMAVIVVCLYFSGCRSLEGYRNDADNTASRLISSAQERELGKTEPIVIETPEETLRKRLMLSQGLQRGSDTSLGFHAMEDNEYWQAKIHSGNISTDDFDVLLTEGEPLILGLVDALQIAARNSYEFQSEKEKLFQAALALDLEREEFRFTFEGMISGKYEQDMSGDGDTEFSAGSAQAGVQRVFRDGTELSSSIVVDIAKLLTDGMDSAFGIFADVDITIPLLRGSGQIVTEEPLKQSERDLLYQTRNFERFKRVFAVAIARQYVGVLNEYRQISYVEENYKRLIAASRRAKRLAESGRLPEFQYDQAVQDELRARSRWIKARQSYAGSLDDFKVSLGLPPDAIVELETDELDRLDAVTEIIKPDHLESAEYESANILVEPDHDSGGPLEIPANEAIGIALKQRLDLRTALDQVEDAQRKVYVAADMLRAEITLFGNAQAGARRSSASSATENDAKLNFSDGVFQGLLTIDPGFERTLERNEYRNALIGLRQSVRSYQKLEDQIKLEIRNALRELLQARESIAIQQKAVTLAKKRVDSTDLLLQSGRAAVRDTLEAEEALLNAQNALTAAVVDYRIAEWGLQRDLGVLDVAVDGIWKEYERGLSDK